ncbi:MAG: Crp/Fnr family transcriptional regulator [Candidatus Marinimicrobia bacterium]|nr:Crp/Fnr family transcriptional regulator [Candidatus Neomarinimicrobiota bacterium]
MAEKTKLWYLQNFNLLEGLDKDSLAEMSRRSKMHKSKKKEVLYFPDEQSDTIYFLKEGKVKISRISEDGRTTTLQLIGPGEIFGESAILGQKRHENFAEVVEDAVICTLSKDLLSEMMERNPGLNRSVTKFIGFRIRKIESRMEDLVFKDARERVITFLKRYISTFGKKLVDGIMVRPFLTHQEIADLTATTRQTVNAILNDLVREGKIQYTRRFIKTTSSEKL